MKNLIGKWIEIKIDYDLWEKFPVCLNNLIDVTVEVRVIDVSNDRIFCAFFDHGHNFIPNESMSEKVISHRHLNLLNNDISFYIPMDYPFKKAKTTRRMAFLKLIWLEMAARPQGVTWQEFRTSEKVKKWVHFKKEKVIDGTLLSGVRLTHKSQGNVQAFLQEFLEEGEGYNKEKVVWIPETGEMYMHGSAMEKFPWKRHGYLRRRLINKRNYRYYITPKGEEALKKGCYV